MGDRRPYELPCPCPCGYCGKKLVQVGNLCACPDGPAHGGYYGCPGLDHVTRKRDGQ